MAKPSLRLAPWLKRYQWNKWLVTDIIAGVALSAMVIPESLGYAAVAGLSPEVGLFAAPLAILAYAIFGPSRIVVVATSSSMSAVSATVVGAVAGTDTSAFVALSAWLAIVTGAIYIVVALLRMGWIANFMSKPVMDGFIIGLAIFIIAGQLKNLTGVDVDGGNAISKIIDTVAQLSDWSMLTLAIGLIGIALLFALDRFMPKVPGAIIVLLLGMLAAVVFGLADQGVDMVGKLPTGLPEVGVPSADLSSVLALIPGAFAVALVGFSEGFAAVKAFAPAGSQPAVNRELFAFGMSNVGAGVSSGMVVGGSLSKTAAAASSGAKTQVANLTAGVIVIAALLFIGPVFAYLPEAILAAVVIHAVWGLIDFSKLQALWKVNRFDFAMATTVMVGTLILEPVYAVLLGVVLSLLFIIYRISFPYRTQLGMDTESHRPVDLATHPDAKPVSGVVIYRMDAPLLYPNAEAFGDGLRQMVKDAPRPLTGVVIDCESMFTIDSTGIDALKDLIVEAKEMGVTLVLARIRSDVYDDFERGGVFDLIGHDSIHDRVGGAVAVLRRDETNPPDERHGQSVGGTPGDK